MIEERLILCSFPPWSRTTTVPPLTTSTTLPAISLPGLNEPVEALSFLGAEVAAVVTAATAFGSGAAELGTDHTLCLASLATLV